jgi:hypothetical protein
MATTKVGFLPVPGSDNGGPPARLRGLWRWRYKQAFFLLAVNRAILPPKQWDDKLFLQMTVGKKRWAGGAGQLGKVK